MEDFRRNLDEARNFLFSGACTLADMDGQSREVLYGNSDSYFKEGSLSYVLFGLGLIGLAGKLYIDAHKAKGLSIPAHLLFAGGSAAIGAGLIGYSLLNVLSE